MCAGKKHKWLLRDPEDLPGSADADPDDLATQRVNEADTWAGAAWPDVLLESGLTVDELPGLSQDELRQVWTAASRVFASQDAVPLTGWLAALQRHVHMSWHPRFLPSELRIATSSSALTAQAAI